MEGLGGIQGNDDFTLADWQGMDVDPALTNPLLLGNYSGLSLEDAWEDNMYLNSQHEDSPFRQGSGMDNDYDAGYMMHHYIGEDGYPYVLQRTVAYDENGKAIGFNDVKTEERLYYWQPSDEHKRTGRDEAVAGSAQGKEFQGSLGAGYYTEAEIRAAWEAGDMRQMQEQGVTWDKYWSFVTGVTDLAVAGGEANMSNPDYAALVNGLGIPTQFENRGDVYNFNGFGYSRDYWSDKSDAGPIIKMAMAAAVSWATGPLLVGAFQGAGMSLAAAKAASAAVISSAQQYMTTGELSLEDALLSAALAYGGSELSDALQGSGVLGEIGSKVTEFGDSIAQNGGDVLSAALQAGGLSLVSQLVREGELDWKEAAIAAAMAGGTVLLADFLSGIGKSGAENEVLEEIKVTAKHKGTVVGEDMYQLEDGTVIYAPAEGKTSVLGNMSTLDLDGDGQLTGNDLQEIKANNYEYKDPKYVYIDQAGGGHKFREGGTYYVSEDGIVYQQGDVKYIDGGPDGTYLVRDGDGNEFYVKEATYGADGRFTTSGTQYYKDANGNVYTLDNPESDLYYDKDGLPYIRVDDGNGNLVDTPVTVHDDGGEYLTVNGYYDGSDGSIRTNIEDLTTPNAITDNATNQYEPYWGENPNWSDDPNYYGSRYTPDADGYITEDPIYWKLETGFYTRDAVSGAVVPIPAEEVPPEIKDKVTDSNKPKGQDNNSPATGPSQESDPTGSTGGGTTDTTGGIGTSGPSGGASLPGGNNDSTGNTGNTGNQGGGTEGLPDFSTMTPAEIMAWWAANGGFGAFGGGSTGSGSNSSTSGSTTGSGGEGATTGTGAGGAGGGGGAGAGGTGGNEGGGGSSTNGTGTGGGTGTSGGTGTGTGGAGSGTGGGTTGTGTGAGTGTSGGAGEGGGTDGGEGGGSGGTSGGGTGGTSGGTGSGEGGGGEGGGGSGGDGRGGYGMLSGGGGSETQWGDLFPAYQFRKFQYTPPPEPTIGMRLFDELFSRK